MIQTSPETLPVTIPETIPKPNQTTENTQLAENKIILGASCIIKSVDVEN